MEPDENDRYVSTIHATPADWRAGAKVCLEKIPAATDADAVELRENAEAYIKIAELLEEDGVSCLLELMARH